MAAESGSSPDRPAPDPDAEEDDNGGGGGVEDRASSPETAPDHRRRPESDRSPSDRRAGDADDPTAFGFLPPPLPREEEKEEGEEDNDFTGDDNGGDPVLLPGAGPARAQDDAAAAAAAGAEFTLRGRRRTLPSTVMTRASPVAAKAHPSSSSSSAGLSSGRSDVLRGATTAASPPALPLPPSPSPPHPQDDPRWSTPSSFLSAVEPAAAAATATATPASRDRQRQETDHSNHVSPQLLPIDLDEVVDDDDQFWNYFASYNAFDLSGSPLVDRAIDKVRQVRQEVERTLLSRAAGRRGVNKVEIEARLRKRFAALKRQVDTSTRVISEKLAEAPMIRLRDRVSFLLGVTGMWCSAMVMAGWPQHVPIAYTLKIVVLVTARFVIYRKKQWHYFLFDMCYVVNVLLLIYLYVLPESRSLFTIIFGLSHGPLAWAILAWRNSMVFHSFDKVTSVAVHFEPPMTLFTLRWFHAAAKHGDGPRTPVGTDDTVGLGLLAYAAWQAAYYFFVEKGRAHKIRGGSGRVTSYTWLLSDTKNPIRKLITAFGEQSSLGVFMCLQLVYTVLTLLPVAVFSRNIYIHGAFLFTIFSVSVWNGANYYFSEYFARVNLENLRSELTGLREAVSSTSVSASPSPCGSPSPHVVGTGKRTRVKEFEHQIGSENKLKAF